MLAQDHKIAIRQWSQQMLEKGFIVLDTETTGLRDGEVIQIAVIDHHGSTLLDTLVKPVYRIPPDAIKIHGITDQMVQRAPGWPVIAAQLHDVFAGQHDLIVYNAEYDRRIIRRSSFHAQISEPDWPVYWHCAMKAYAQFYGVWNDYRNQYAWQKLTDACRQQHIADPDAPAHSALGDCLRTLALIKAMAA